MAHQTSNWIYKTAVILACTVFSAGLAGFILIGTTSRYLQDDYCYSVILRGDNFFRQQLNSYLHETTYSGNRFSLTLGMGLSELFGQRSVSVLPGLVLFAWVMGLYSVIRRISGQDILVRLNRIEALIVSEALALFTLSIAPNWIQIFFWRPGMFPYFAPIVTATYMILFILIASRAGKWRLLWWFGVFLLAFLTGGFSETAVCVEVVLLTVIFAITFVMRNSLRRMTLPAGIALLGSLAAMALLVASPNNAPRIAMAYGATSNLQSAIVDTLNGAAYFYIFIAYRPTLLYASALMFFFLLGTIVSHRHEQPSLSWKQFLAWILGAVLIAYLLTAAAMAPSFYAESSYPGKRALTIPSFINILLASIVGFKTGIFLSGQVRNIRFPIAAILAGVGIAAIDALWLTGMAEHFYPPAYPDMRSYLRQHTGLAIMGIAFSAILWGWASMKGKSRITIPLLILIYLIQPGLMGARIFSEYPILQRRAELWDWRQSQIISARDNGNKELEVRALDSLAGLTDISSNPGYWVNNCIEDYYGLTSIKGIEPVLDPMRLTNP